jgi:signal transduction protein with GAF and PtsI domain
MLIELTGEQMKRTFAADIVYVALLDPQTNMIHFPYIYGEQVDSLPLGEGLTSRVLQTGQPLLINKDLDTQRAAMGVTRVGKREALSYLGVPIISNKQAIGVISVQSTQQEEQFETIFAHQLLKTMGETLEEGFMTESLAGEMYNDMLYWEVARKASEGRGLGLARILQDQMEVRMAKKG